MFDTLDPTLAVSALSMLVAAMSALYARQALQRSREALMYEVLTHIASDYRSLEMFVAVKSLWRFKREHPTNIAEAYNERRLKDAAHVESLTVEERTEYEGTTVHYQRRLVSHFYSLLASLHERGLPEQGAVYALWTKDDLKIIPEVILPLEQTVSAGIESQAVSPVIARLQKLYDDCPNTGGGATGVQPIVPGDFRQAALAGSPLNSNVRHSRIEQRSPGHYVTNNRRRAPVNAADLEAKYTEAVAKATADYDWYKRRRLSYMVSSWAIRVLAAATLIAGATLPIASPTGAVSLLWFPFPSAAQAALVCLVIAGLLVGLDQVFLVTGTWSRYISAMMRIETLKCTASWDWQDLKARLPDPVPPEEISKAMLIFRTLAVGSRQVVETETTAWSAELAKAVDQLQALVKDQRASTETLLKEQEKTQEAARKLAEKPAPGAIRVKFDGAINRLAGNIKVTAAGKDQESDSKNLAIVFPSVPTGLQEVSLTGSDSANAVIRAKNVVAVVSNGIADVTLTIPNA